MPTGRHNQTSFASGEFDRLLWSREEISMFYSSARIIENAVPLPQGGAKRAEGWRFAALQRGALSLVDSAGFTLSAPNGGTAASAESTDSGTQLLTTTGISTTTAYVILHVDCGSAERFSVVDFAPVLSGGTQDEATISLQSSDDNAAWTTRDSIVIGTTQYERRFALAPDNDLGTHRYWRIIVDNAGGADFSTDVISAYKFRAFTEDGYSQDGTPGEAQLKRITAGIMTEFWALVTQGNVDLFDLDGTWKASADIPHEDSEIPDVKFAQERDTLVLYHQEVETYVVQRLGVDTEWRSGVFEFSSVSQFAFEDSTSGGLNEVQEATFSSMSAGNRLAFEYNGEVSAEVSWSATPATNVTNFTAALEGMADITSVTVTNVAGTSYEIEFDGVDGLKRFAILVVLILDGSGTVDVTRKQFGRPHQEDLWSASRGYAACGTIIDGRHWLGGFKGASDAFAASRVGDLTDFKEDADPTQTSPILAQLDTDEETEIETFFAGRALQLFTSSGEFFWPDKPITPTNVTSITEASQNGHYRYTQPVDVQGATFFVDRNGNAVREFLFSELQQSYTAEPVSTLASHLVKQPTAMAYRRASDEDDPPLLYLVNTGRDRDNDLVPMAMVTTNRAQEVTAFARRITQLGTVKSVAASHSGAAAVLVNRTLAGEAWNYLEVMDENQMSDCAIEVENSDAETFTATASQTVFTYTFTSPASADNLGVFVRNATGDLWDIVEPDDYTIDLGAKTVTFDTGRVVGTQVYLAPLHTTAALGVDFLDGIECYVHVDGLPAGEATPAAGSVTIPADEGYYFQARIGLRMVPRIVFHPFKGQGGPSPTMKKQRIFRALLTLERTYSCAIAVEGRTPRDVALTDHDSGTYDKTLEEILFSGTKRVSGLSSWQTEPRLVITQNTPGPWLMRACIYDVRY